MSNEPPVMAARDARGSVIGTGGAEGAEVFRIAKYTRLICLVVSASALVNLILCTITGFVGIGWDWDVLLVEICMQATNFAIAACLYYRRLLLGHARANRAVAVLVTGNTLLRAAVYWMLLEIVLSPTDSNDGECKVMAADGRCQTYWYIRTKAVQNFATASLVTMALDTLLTVFSMLNLRAVLRLEQHADALAQVLREKSDVPLMDSGLA